MAPVLILTVARSGSSMVASIFADHGLYVGPFDPASPHGFRVYENTAVREAINRLCRPNRATHLKEFNDGAGISHVKRVFDRHMPRDRRWLYKCGVDHWPVLDGLDMRVVLVRRNAKSVIASNLAKNESDPDITREIVLARSNYIDSLGFPTVMTDDVVRGDYTTLIEAFDYCGIQFDEAKANARINPDLWRF